MLLVTAGNAVGKVGAEYLDPAIRNGHFGEGLFERLSRWCSLGRTFESARLGRPVIVAWDFGLH